MKSFKYLAVPLVVLLLLALGCEKSISTEDPSTITNFVTFELTDGNELTIGKGEVYVEPGFVAMEGETDVTSSVQVSGTVGEGLGVYEITYSAKNVDGFTSSVVRKVIVYDPTAPDDDFSGDYEAKVVRTESDGSDPRVRTNSLAVYKVAQGIFYVEGLLGNYYAIGSGYGPSYRMNGYIGLNSDYTISLLYSYLSGWADSLADFLNGTYDPATGVLTWESIYAGNDTFAVEAY